MYVLQAPIANEPWIDDKLNPVFRDMQGLYNDCVAEIRRRIDILEADPEYIECKRLYREYMEKSLPKKSEEFKVIIAKMSDKRKELGLSGNYDIQKEILVPIKQRKYNGIASAAYAEICKDLWGSCEFYFGFRKNKNQKNKAEIHFKNYNKGDYVSVYAGAREKESFKSVKLLLDSQNNRFVGAIVYNSKEIILPLTIRDYYFYENLAKAINMPCHTSKEGLLCFMGDLTESLKNKYGNQRYLPVLFENIRNCNVKFEEIRGIRRYTLAITINDDVPQKRIEKIVENVSTNVVGIDLGVQTISLVYRYSNGIVFDAEVFELAEDIDNVYMLKMDNINRNMERKRRLNNPDNFNEDGTAKKGRRDWVKSKNYEIEHDKQKEYNRTKSEIIKISHATLVKHILSKAHNVIIEPMDFAELQKRKRDENGVTVKRGFGKSINKKSPALFMKILQEGIKSVGGTYIETDKYSTRASQYNHITDTYVKKELNERSNWLIVEDKQITIQRDLYSAFLLSNVIDGKNIDRQMCFKGFDSFIDCHNRVMAELKLSKQQAIKNIL